MLASILALLLAVSPAHAGKKKDAPPPPPPAVEAPARAAIDPAFEADIRKLLEMTGSAALGQQVMDQMLSSFQTSMPGMDPTFWADLKKEMDANELVELIVPIYARHLTHDDVKQLIGFYDSPVGRKLISTQPAITAESMQVGQQWGQEVGMRVMTKIQSQQMGR